MLLWSNMPATGQYPHAARFGTCFRTQILKCFFFPVALRPDSGSRPLITEIRDHTHWIQETMQESFARVISPPQRTLTTHNTHKRQNIHAPGGIRTHNRSKREAADQRLRPRGHRERHFLNTHTNNIWPCKAVASSHLSVSGVSPLCTVRPLMLLTLVQSITITVCLHSTRQFLELYSRVLRAGTGWPHQPFSNVSI